ncbi:hypothetical protein AQUCO_00200232v1 [Aquilegia coerulea]|uniref:SKP1-like protein n=1 Tax=Aquilegia coerulea TaxID=218851 RepID=A0A2G5F2B3_AQUCA|nr:hypothetical protein AQUCO_00200232v1 [Aquilegia coerulea]
MVEKKFLTLRTSDGETFKVEEDVILQSETIKQLVEDGCGDGQIPLANVTGNILTMVIEYCKYHLGNKKLGEEIKDWDDKFIDVDQKIIFDVILAANYMNIKGLLDLACVKISKMISGKPVPEIRKILGIEIHGFSEEEEEENRRWNLWAYED